MAKTEVLGKKIVLVSICAPQIQHVRALESK